MDYLEFQRKFEQPDGVFPSNHVLFFGGKVDFFFPPRLRFLDRVVGVILSQSVKLSHTD